MKKIIITALHAEAKPFIEFFNLKKSNLFAKIPFYSGEPVFLCVSGIGKMRCAIATASLLAQEKDPHNVVVFNVGICGSTTKEVNLGELFFVNKVIDHGSGRSYYPDIVIEHNLPESQLMTFDKPVTQLDFPQEYKGLVDMEASGFFEAALTFLSPHQVVCLKIVSDFLEGEVVNKVKVSGLVERNMEAINGIISSYDALCSFLATDVLDANEHSLLEQLSMHFRLTFSQYHQLIEWARSYKIHKKGSLEILRHYLQYSVSDKRERNNYLEKLRSLLLDE